MTPKTSIATTQRHPAGPHLSGRGLEAGLVVGRVEEPLRGNDLHGPLGSVQQAVQPHRQRQVGRPVVGKGDVVRDVLHHDHSAGRGGDRDVDEAVQFVTLFDLLQSDTVHANNLIFPLSQH